MKLSDEQLSENLGLNGLLCAACKAPQYDTPGGATCPNGHGGADGIPAPDADDVPAPDAASKARVAWDHWTDADRATELAEAMEIFTITADEAKEISAMAKATTSGKYKPCERCRDARAAEDFDQAITCSSCKGRGVVRTRGSWLCNGCGDCLCPGKEGEMNGDCPHGLVDATVTGGYSSEHLSDMTSYTFSLCEKCLRDAFATFKNPPKTVSYNFSGEDEDEEPYAKEVADKAAYEARNAVEKRIFQHFVDTDRCTDTNRIEGEGPYCGERSVGTIERMGARWPRCSRHMRDSYVHSHVVVEAPGRRITYEENARVGRGYLAWFDAARGGGPVSRERPEPKDEHEAAVFLSTLFSLVMDPSSFHLASAELTRLGCTLPPKASEWEHPTVAVRFPPHMAAEASAANDWLAWGRKAGYVNAVAHPLVMRDVKSLWKIGEEA
jgi:hypothetical protein